MDTNDLDFRIHELTLRYLALCKKYNNTRYNNRRRELDAKISTEATHLKEAKYRRQMLDPRHPVFVSTHERDAIRDADRLIKIYEMRLEQLQEELQFEQIADGDEQMAVELRELSEKIHRLYLERYAVMRQLIPLPVETTFVS